MKNTNSTDRFEQLSPQDSAKQLRRELKAAFPGTKFSLRMSRGTAWGSYTISWEGAPFRDEVAAIADRFEGKSFDGMDDSTTFTRATIEVDGETFESGIGYISLSGPWRSADDRAATEATETTEAAPVQQDASQARALELRAAFRLVG